MFKRMEYLRRYLIIFALTMTIGTILHFAAPSWREIIAAEDRILENLSALFYLCTGVMGIVQLRATPQHRNLLLLLSIVGFVGFLDELSYGQRIWPIEFPYLRGVEIDAVHDLFQVFYHLYLACFSSSEIFAGLFFVFAATLALLLTLKFRCILKRLFKFEVYSQPYTLILINIILLFIALIIDLELIWHSYLFLVEELFEMNSALALLFAVFSCKKTESDTITT